VGFIRDRSSRPDTTSIISYALNAFVLLWFVAPAHRQEATDISWASEFDHRLGSRRRLRLALRLGSGFSGDVAIAFCFLTWTEPVFRVSAAAARSAKIAARPLTRAPIPAASVPIADTVSVQGCGLAGDGPMQSTQLTIGGGVMKDNR
jgi:hypothetical protein